MAEGPVSLHNLQRVGGGVSQIENSSMSASRSSCSTMVALYAMFARTIVAQNLEIASHHRGRRRFRVG